MSDNKELNGGERMTSPEDVMEIYLRGNKKSIEFILDWAKSNLGEGIGVIDLKPELTGDYRTEFLDGVGEK